MTAVIGVRLNNPLNVKRATAMGAPRDVDWRGRTPLQGHPIFVDFLEPVYGFRCGARILVNYQRRLAIRVLEDVIARWAPSSENDVRAYVGAVAQSTGLSWATVLDLESPATLLRLIEGMTRVEVGARHPFVSVQMMDGIQLALARE